MKGKEFNLIFIYFTLESNVRDIGERPPNFKSQSNDKDDT